MSHRLPRASSCVLPHVLSGLLSGLLGCSLLASALVACDKSSETSPATPPGHTDKTEHAATAKKPEPSSLATSVPNPSASSSTASTGTASTGMASTTASASASASGGPTIELVPKVSFGPIKLGATKADVEALKILKVHPQYSGMTIPYTVYYDGAGKVQRIQLSLLHAPADVKIGGLIIPRIATFSDSKSLLADCKDEPPAIGGTTSKCRGGAVNVSIGSGSPTEVWIEAAR